MKKTPMLFPVLMAGVVSAQTAVPSGTVFMVPEMTIPGTQQVTVTVVQTPDAAPAKDVTATLIVQNHVQDAEYRDNLLGLADVLSAELADRGFRCVIPDNVLGENQNKGQAGEDTSGSSAVGLTGTLATDCMITASIRDLTYQRMGKAPQQLITPVLRMTLNVSSRNGTTIAGQNLTIKTRPMTLRNFENDGGDHYQLLLEEASRQCADAVALKMKGRTLGDDVALATVEFTCSVQGADVRIDDFAYGTAPLAVRLTPGVHTVEVTYPFCVPYKSKANVQDGQRYNVVLELTEEGRRRYQDMALFAETIDRIRKTGATDDYVRRALADGQMEFLKASHFKWDGALQTLTIERDGASPVVYGPTTVVK